MKKSTPQPERAGHTVTTEAPWPVGDKLQRLCLAGVVAIFVGTPLVPSESAALEGSGMVLVILWMTMLIGWGLMGLRYGRAQVRFGAIDGAVLAFLAWHTLSALVMGPRGHARPALNMMWEYISLAVGYFLARQSVRTAIEARAVAAVMIALAVCLSVHGFYQVGYSLPRDRARWEREPDVVLSEAGIVAPVGSPLRSQYANRISSKEPFATFSLTNSLAGFLAPWLVFVLGIGVQALPPAIRTRTRAGVIGSAVMIAACLLLTKSRSGYIATAVGVAVLGLWATRGHWRAARKPIGGGALLVIALVAAASWFGAVDIQILTEARKSLGYRAEYWQATLAMIADHPWFGCGPGNFQEYYARYKLPQSSEMIADPHNFALEIWSTAGTPALVAWLLLLGLLAWQFRTAWTRADNPASGGTAAGTTLSVAHVYVGGLLGLLAGFVAALLAGFAPDLMALAAGVPAAVISLFALHAWVRRGTVPAGLALLGIVVWLVNLLAAGGMGFPGVAGTFWILLALALCSTDEAVLPRSLGRSAWGGLLAGAVALWSACWLTGYGPVLNGRAESGLAELAITRGQMSTAEQAYLLWAQNDPWSAEPYLGLSDMYHRIWLHSGQADHFRDFESAMAKALTLHPRSQVVRSIAGDRYLHAYRLTNRDEYLRAALTEYERAVELYPNSSIRHAQLAWAWNVAREPEKAEREAHVALELDAKNPHTEQKLREQTLFDVEPDPHFSSQPAAAGDDRVEPLMIRLRNTIRTSRERPSRFLSARRTRL